MKIHLRIRKDAAYIELSTDETSVVDVMRIHDDHCTLNGFCSVGIQGSIADTKLAAKLIFGNWLLIAGDKPIRWQCPIRHARMILRYLVLLFPLRKFEITKKDITYKDDNVNVTDDCIVECSAII